MNDIKVGDIVQLKHGGQLMTVSTIGRRYEFSTTLCAWCVWFDGNGKRTHAAFELESLRTPSKTRRFFIKTFDVFRELNPWKK